MPDITKREIVCACIIAHPQKMLVAHAHVLGSLKNRSNK